MLCSAQCLGRCFAQSSERIRRAARSGGIPQPLAAPILCMCVRHLGILWGCQRAHGSRAAEQSGTRHTYDGWMADHGARVSDEVRSPQHARCYWVIPPRPEQPRVCCPLCGGWSWTHSTPLPRHSLVGAEHSLEGPAGHTYGCRGLIHALPCALARVALRTRCPQRAPPLCTHPHSRCRCVAGSAGKSTAPLLSTKEGPKAPSSWAGAPRAPPGSTS